MQRLKLPDHLPGRQPTGPVKIDWSNPLTKGLTHAYIMRDGIEARDLVGNTHFDTPVGVSQLVGAGGRGINFTGSNNYLRSSSSIDPAGSLPLSISVLVDLTGQSTGDNGSIVAISDLSSGTNHIVIQYSSGDDALRGIVRSGNFYAAVGPSISSRSGPPKFATFAVAAANNKILYMDGEAGTPNTDTTNYPTGIDTFAMGSLPRNGSFTQTDPYSGAVHLVLIHDRALTQEEHTALANDPYQIFVEAVSLPVFVDNGPSGGSEIIGSLSAQESGSDTFSGAGSISVSGALTSQEAGADTLAGAGAVPISGTFSVAETGSDTLVVSGSPVVGGVLSVQEGSEPDTLSAAGELTVSGSLAVQEIGQDTFEAAGSTIGGIVGALDAQEAGEDTFFGSGLVSIVGSFAAQEIGGDTFAGVGVTLAGVTGSLAASESGSDTFTGSGGIVVSGALVVSESGSDTFAGSGGLIVSGLLTVQEAGNDTSTILGSVSIGGSLLVQETGVDTFAGEGIVSEITSEGDLLVQEAGADIFAGIGTIVISGSALVQEAESDDADWTGIVAIYGALLVQEIGSDGFTGGGYLGELSIPSGRYLIKIEAENRIIKLEVEDRIFKLLAENRTFKT